MKGGGVEKMEDRWVKLGYRRVGLIRHRCWMNCFPLKCHWKEECCCCYRCCCFEGFRRLHHYRIF